MRRSLLAVLLAIAACARLETGTRVDPLLEYPSNPNHSAVYAQSVTGVKYHQGAVMTGDTNLHLIFYGALTPASQDLLTDFATNLSGSPTANVLTTFSDAEGNRPSGHFNVDRHSFPAISFGPLSDAVMVQIIQALTGGQPPDPSGIYVFVAGTDADCITKDGTSYCDGGAGGWHHTVTVGNSLAKIAFIGNKGFCRGSAPCTEPGPNGACGDTDHQAQVIWHEVAEAVSDPEPFGGYTPEVADLCEGSFHSDDPSRPAAGFVELDLDWPAAYGATANVHLGANDYSLQPIWQNVAGGGCVRRLALHRPSVPLRGYAAGDFNYDSLGDLIEQSSDTGKVLQRLVDYTGNFGASTVLGTIGASHQIYGVADFNGDAIGDLLLRNLDTGRLALWILGVGQAASIEIAASIPLEWAVKAVGDFDGNGYADILFMNLTDNTLKLWRNNGTLASFTIGGLPSVSPHPSASENIESVGAGDIDGDGKADVLWHHMSSDTYSYSTFAGTTQTMHSYASSGFDYVLGMGNLRGYATPVTVSGTNVKWAGGTAIAPVPAPEWRYAGASKWAGQASLLWRNRRTGDVVRWVLDANGVLQTATTVLAGEKLNRQIIAF